MAGSEVSTQSVIQARATHLTKADRAWSARVAGGTWAQAAEVAGYGSPQAAIKSVRRIYGELPDIDREDLRHLWRERLEALWRQSMRDVAEQRTGAITAAVRVAQTALVLDGLNAPLQVDARITHTLETIEKELLDHGI